MKKKKGGGTLSFCYETHKIPRLPPAKYPKKPTRRQDLDPASVSVSRPQEAVPL